MPDFALLISPAAGAAYFADVREVALAEIAGLAGVEVGDIETRGGMEFLRLTCAETRITDLLRLSFAQGVFQIEEGKWAPVEGGAGFLLHEDFVSGEKYRGKTNEMLTRMLINLALQEADTGAAKPRLLDPMCGRGTSLFWAMRFGLSATGIEQDGAALNEIRRGLKKWTKLHRQKHKLVEGWVQKSNKKGVGKYLDFMAEGQVARVITGDTVNARDLVGRRPFDLLVTDIPYGVQHMGGADGARSPLATIEAAAPGWAACLAPGGVMAIAFNSYIPKRARMEAAFEGLDLQVLKRNVAHRMSESILRDVLLLRKNR
ncbi:TRM11 family methyltransferase [Shimia sp.]|uniref:TRM11 family SAM-dependent methyltransferase n=1 Tax=Shimia sp. TaxID=1954381 RepID=UPI003563F5B7